jgi:glyceraldehyde 3-phosphate dehydrogenase
MVNVAINGTGRIGRCVIRAFIKEAIDGMNISQINSTMDLPQLVHLIKYDSVHGVLNADIAVDGEYIVLNGRKILVTSQRNISDITWYNTDIVLECTGKFTSSVDAMQHVAAGAKKVIISAPAKEKDVPTIVCGVNEILIKTLQSDVISIGSCTTNCLAPLAKVINDNFAIVSGFVTTVHAYTGDQNLVDNSHKDLRRSRAAALSIVPTSTGAAKTIGIVIPQLDGKLDGAAMRVPTANVSVVDCAFMLGNNATVEQVNDAIIMSANRFLSYTNEPLVSIDFTGNLHSSVVDLNETRMVGNLLRIVSWYDNEYAFSVRMLDVAKMLLM